MRYTAQKTQRSEAQARAEGEATLLQLLESELAEGDTVETTRFTAARKGDWLLVTLWAECHQQIGQQVVLPRS